jgi:hypothetical protein
MNQPRKIISWEPEHRDLSLNKRSKYEFDHDQRPESHPRRQDIELKKFSCENISLNYPKLMDHPMKSFSPVPSHRVDSQKMILPNSFRDTIPKISQRSILGGQESNIDMRANMSNYDVLGPKNEMFIDPNICQHDNNPLNNSDSDLENDIFKIKTLSEKDCISEKFNGKGSRLGQDKTSFNQNYIVESGLSEFAPIKPPNAYRQITSINYSNYNENLSGRDQKSLLQNPNFLFEEDKSFKQKTQNNFIDPRRRMTPKELFDMQRRNIAQNSVRNLKQPWNKVSEKSFGKENPFTVQKEFYSKTRIPVSDRAIINQNHPLNSRSRIASNMKINNNMNMSYKPSRNVFHSSEKSISINEELMRKRFQIKSSMAQFNHYPHQQFYEKRRDFSPFESNEPSQFKRVKKSSGSQHRETSQNRFSNEVRGKSSNMKYECDELKKKNEDERIENNMLESIEMIELGQFKRYRKLLAFLISLFVTGNVKPESIDLFSEELQILKIIIYRKFKKHIDIR